MAELVLKNAFLQLGANDISANVRSIELPAGAEMLDDTAMGDSARSNAPGLQTWSITVEFNQDFAASALDSILWPLLGTTFTVEVRPDTGAVSTSNPKWTGTGTLESYTPIGGAVGDQAIAPITIQSAGVLTRATA